MWCLEHRSRPCKVIHRIELPVSPNADEKANAIARLFSGAVGVRLLTVAHLGQVAVAVASRRQHGVGG